MSDILSALKELLSQYDVKIEPISEMQISDSIHALVNNEDKTEPPAEWSAERFAFDFAEDHHRRETGWSTHFGPMFVRKKDDGTASEYPSVKWVTPKMIQYWANRAKNALHPVLRARYADLAWDLGKLVTKNNRDYHLAQIAVDSIIEIAQRRCHNTDVDVIGKLERALSLATSLNDPVRIARVKDAIINYEKWVAEDDKPGLWGFAYDLLYDNDKVTLSDTEKADIVGDLEMRLKRVSNRETPNSFDPWASECAALRLAKHYRRLGNLQDVRRVLLVYGAAFMQIAEQADALQASAWLENVHRRYLEYGLNRDAELLSVMLQGLGPKAVREMKAISHTFEIPKTKMDAYVEALTAGSFEHVLSLMAAHYVPSRTQVETQLKKLANDHPISFLFPTQFLDHKGRPGKRVGSLENDLTGHVVKLMSQNMSISAVFMRTGFHSFCDKFKPNEAMLADYILASPVFDDKRRPIIEAGLREHLAGNHLVAVHLLVPQIEEAIRNLLEKAGGSVFAPRLSDDGSFRLKTLGELLRDPRIAEVLGDDATFYFRVLLCDQRGWNLRNAVCHGYMDPDRIGPRASDRVLHVLLCLAQVKGEPPSEE